MAGNCGGKLDVGRVMLMGSLQDLCKTGVPAKLSELLCREIRDCQKSGKIVNMST